ncbi:MAG TPA: PKD domain-containing protein [Baekduia sp.]|nr:PKD domain-containing protein [Baekduia sp.]
MIRTRCAAAIGSLAASLVFACAATATPATPAISVQQRSALTMQLTSSTGTHWSWTIVDTAGAVVAIVVTSSDNPMTVTLPAAGDYRALLDATDDDPVLTDPAHAETTFHVYAQPAADFSSTQLSGMLVQFLDTSTGEPTSWTWTLPSGTFNGQVPPIQTLPVGTSTVSLEVANAAGTSTITRTVVVNGPPVADLNILSSPTAMGSPVLLDASRSTDPNQDALTYSWDLDGDGHYGDATGELQTVSYPKPGRYRIGVQVSDGHGATSTAQATITVLVDQAPSVSFANDPLQPAIGATVTFTATATDADGTVDHVDWDLDDDGDFDDAAGPWASWSFDVAGRHRIAVRATDDRGVATVAFRSIVVTGPVLPTTTRTEPLPAPTGPSSNGSAPAAAIPNVPAPSSTRIPLLAPFPVVRISGTLYRGSVRISLLKVQAPPGATIRVRCHGGSCASKRPDVRVQAARKPLRVHSFEQRPLRAGTVIEVLVTAPGQIGKYTRFTVRRGAAPARSDLCLPPGHTKPTACPAT